MEETMVPSENALPGPAWNDGERAAAQLRTEVLDLEWTEGGGLHLHLHVPQERLADLGLASHEGEPGPISRLLISRRFALEHDPRGRQFTLGGQVLFLTHREYEVLSFLVHHHDQVLTPAQLIEGAWEGHLDDTDVNPVRACISRLRKELGPEGAGLIETVWGVGYCFRPEAASHPTRRRPAPA
jgi:DNA-binding winged helix-turn-helix (wHTH) protein